MFDVSLGCRLCFNLCPSFPALFRAVDAGGGGVRKLTEAQRSEVVESCYQCKLCYIKCPYTPGDGHEFQLDFPRLMQRAKAVRARSRGIALRERLLAMPDLLGRLARLTPRLANWANRLLPEHPGEWRDRSASGQVRIVVDHPTYSHEGVLAPTVAEALADDLEGSG